MVTEMKINSGKRTFLNIMICIFALGMLISGGVAGGTLLKMQMEANAFAKLAKEEQVDVAPEEIGIDAEKFSAEELAKQMALHRRVAKCERLAGENEDFKAWLMIEDTKINYPVMANAEDSQYYLHRDYKGNYSFGGTPFLGEDCDENSQSIIVYAHHMNNGTMFGELEKYEKQDYRDQHPVIHFDTAKEARDYEVVAAFRTRLLYDNEEGFRYYEYIGDLDKEQREQFCDEVAKINVYKDGPEMPEDGEYIMLSTCAYHTRYGRFVVVGRRIEE